MFDMLDPRSALDLVRLEREERMRQFRTRAPQELRPRHTVRTRAAVTLHALADRLDRAA